MEDDMCDVAKMRALNDEFRASLKGGNSSAPIGLLMSVLLLVERLSMVFPCEIDGQSAQVLVWDAAATLRLLSRDKG
jgi:hypothetical protein